MNAILLIMDVLQTILCLGLNKLIQRWKYGRWANYVLAAVVVNEIRGVYFVYVAMEKAGGWAGLLSVLAR